MFGHGIMPLDTPLSGSWLNMAESIQRIIKRRALECQYLETPAGIISRLEATVRGWNREPTPFEWGGKRAARRIRSRARRHALGGSGAYTRRAIRRGPALTQQWQRACQMTHLVSSRDCGRGLRASAYMNVLAPCPPDFPGAVPMRKRHLKEPPWNHHLPTRNSCLH